MKKKSVKSIAMVGTGMSEYLASKMLQIFKDSDECDQLQFLSFFGHHSLRAVAKAVAKAVARGH
jgi:hypothetical protein